MSRRKEGTPRQQEMNKKIKKKNGEKAQINNLRKNEEKNKKKDKTYHLSELVDRIGLFENVTHQFS